MTLQFKLRRANRRRTFRKFRRCKLKDWDSTNKDIKAEEWDVHQQIKLLSKIIINNHK